jgi:hypothetical protein
MTEKRKWSWCLLITIFLSRFRLLTTNDTLYIVTRPSNVQDCIPYTASSPVNSVLTNLLTAHFCHKRGSPGNGICANAYAMIELDIGARRVVPDYTTRHRVLFSGPCYSVNCLPGWTLPLMFWLITVELLGVYILDNIYFFGLHIKTTQRP